MRRFRMIVVPVTLLAAALAGCGQSQLTVPSGAQLVHLTATASEVRLSPPSVHAGDVYLELDEPAVGGSFLFVAEAASAGAYGPLTATALERLARGDTQGTVLSSLGPSCSGTQGADRGHLSQPGVCGDVWKLVLVVGKYAILGPGWTQQMVEPSVNPTLNPAGLVVPPTMAVLEVLP